MPAGIGMSRTGFGVSRMRIRMSRTGLIHQTPKCGATGKGLINQTRTRVSNPYGGCQALLTLGLPKELRPGTQEMNLPHSRFSHTTSNWAALKIEL